VAGDKLNGLVHFLIDPSTTLGITSVKSVVKKNIWYIAGLHFECQECGGCCSGPGEGYIWVTRPEIEIIADFLKLTVGQLRQKYLKRVGLRTTIIEHGTTKDCIFLQEETGGRQCMIYSVRPSQCRSWPFWPENLKSADAWNRAAQKCPGISRGRLYSVEEIEKIKRDRRWWHKAEQTTDFSKE
jgi:Fe-S-cluster containining protein